MSVVEIEGRYYVCVLCGGGTTFICDERGRVWNEEARGCTYLLHVFKNVRSPQASFVESTRDQLHTNATYASHVAHMYRESFSKAPASM